MHPLRPLLSLTLALGALSTLALIACMLALTDIAHGEADVRLEWWVVRIGFLVVALFIGTVFMTIGKVLQAMKEVPDVESGTA